MGWRGSQAERVCRECFGGDMEAMRRHAQTYLSQGHSAVPPLGLAFRKIVLKQNRHVWWRRALAFIEEQLSMQAPPPSDPSRNVSAAPGASTPYDEVDPSRNSAYLASVREHIFMAELQKDGILRRRQAVRVFRPEVDDQGYDLMLECNGVLRPIQLKSIASDGRAREWSVHAAMMERESAGVILMRADNRLNVEYSWFGGPPGRPLANPREFQIARHAKGDAKGRKLERPKLRTVPLKSFRKLASIKELSDTLFGQP